MIRHANPISYLPQYVQEYKEIQCILEGETPEIQKLEDETEIVKNNQFINYCDEKGIAKFEEILHILPNAQDSLSARKAKVIAKWNDHLPYTYRALARKLESMVGKGNFQLSPHFTGDGTPHSGYSLGVEFSTPLSGQVQEIENVLGYMIPANIVVSTKNTLSREMNGFLFYGTGMVETTTIEFVSQTNGNQNIPSTITSVGVVSTLLEREIS